MFLFLLFFFFKWPTYQNWLHNPGLCFSFKFNLILQVLLLAFWQNFPLARILFAIILILNYSNDSWIQNWKELAPQNWNKKLNCKKHNLSVSIIPSIHRSRLNKKKFNPIPSIFNLLPTPIKPIKTHQVH